MRGKGRVQLKAPVYALKDPETGAYIALRGEQPKLARALHLATICPATPGCLIKLQTLASRRLAGVPHELERVDRL